jgi:tRNA modification GTPase
MMQPEDTIVALATPPGQGALGVIRLSGPQAIAIVAAIFRGKDLGAQPGHTLHFGRIVDRSAQPERVVDEVVVALYRAPRSYSGEDVVEISCHGSMYILQEVIALCTRHGASPAQPGAFTQRAFLNGRMDLTQAEAVADLIAGETEAAHRSAMHTLRGGFRKDLEKIREQLLSFSALIELELDFSEEDVEFADRSQLYALITETEAQTEALIRSFRLGNVIRNGVRVAIIGRPNAGKSTLLNALLNEERAIVSDIAGTTRDTIEETLNINGVLFRLIDTAGIREHTTDTIESIGIARSRKAMEEADIIISLFDATTETLNDLEQQKTLFEQQDRPYLLVANKTDLVPDAAGKYASLGAPILFISAREKQHLDILRQQLYDMVVSDTRPAGNTIVTNARHHAALQEVRRSLHDIRRGLDDHLPGDLVALDIRRCLHYLGEITGQITTEDKLDYIFSKFCIGK